MTDRPNHRAAAEGALTDAREWGRQAEEPAPEVGELTCLAYAAVHALLAIHDTLTAADRYATNEAKQRKEAADAPQDATDGDLSAPEGESGAEEGGEAEETLACPECGEGIFDHSSWDDDARSQYRCPLTVNEAVRALIEQAVKQTRGRRG